MCYLTWNLTSLLTLFQIILENLANSEGSQPQFQKTLCNVSYWPLEARSGMSPPCGPPGSLLSGRYQQPPPGNGRSVAGVLPWWCGRAWNNDNGRSWQNHRQISEQKTLVTVARLPNIQPVACSKLFQRKLGHTGLKFGDNDCIYLWSIYSNIFDFCNDSVCYNRFLKSDDTHNFDMYGHSKFHPEGYRKLSLT
jgi:hypothetical protein